MKYIMKAPNQYLRDSYSGAYRKEYVERAYSGQIVVKNGIAVVEAEDQYQHLHRNGYDLVNPDLVCLDCRTIFKSKEERDKHNVKVHSAVQVELYTEKDGKWYCNYCSHNSFSREQDVKAHITKYHSEV